MAMARSVALDKEPAVLDPMMAVLLKPLSALSMATVNVKHINLVDLNVDLALMT